MSRCKRSALGSIAFGLLLLFALPVQAQAPAPKFSFVVEDKPKPEDVVEKKLSARGGLVQLAGNSKVLTGMLGTQGAYQAGANRFSGDAGATYSRSSSLVVADGNANMLVDEGELVRQDQVTSKLFQAKGRYDRFFTLNNSAYLSVQALTDVPAGKELVAGAQVGYSRQLFKSDHQRLVAELGYDLSMEQAAATDADLVPGAFGPAVRRRGPEAERRHRAVRQRRGAVEPERREGAGARLRGPGRVRGHAHRGPDRDHHQAVGEPGLRVQLRPALRPGAGAAEDPRRAPPSPRHSARWRRPGTRRPRPRWSSPSSSHLDASAASARPRRRRRPRPARRSRSIRCGRAGRPGW